jgi:hypothetical protein
MPLTWYAIIPIAANTPGAYGTYWRTEVCIYNSMDFDIDVNIYFYSNDGKYNDLKTINIKPNNVYCIKNILEEFFSYRGYGWLYFSTDTNNDMGVWARIYTKNEDGGTYGQAVDNQALYTSKNKTYLFGIKVNDEFRTNIGVSCYYYCGDLDIEIYNKYGDFKKKYSIKVPLNGVVQFPIDINIEDGYAVIIPNGLIIYNAYMSIVDNKTGDAIFIPSSRKIE